MDRKTVNLKDLPQEQFEIVAALAVRALCEIANYQDPEELREEEAEPEEPDEDGYGYGNAGGLDAEEVVEMAYENVLQTARSAINAVVGQIEPLLAVDSTRP